jgi:hypothetical protein
MALAEIKVETEGPAQIVTKVEVNGQDLTAEVFGVESGFEVGVGGYTTLKIRGAAEITHDPDTLPYADNGNGREPHQPEEPTDE